MTQAEFDALYNSLSFDKSRDLVGADLRELTLRKLDLSATNFENANLSDTYIREVDFSHSNFKHTNFFLSDILDVDFTGTGITENDIDMPSSNRVILDREYK